MSNSSLSQATCQTDPKIRVPSFFLDPVTSFPYHSVINHGLRPGIGVRLSEISEYAMQPCIFRISKMSDTGLRIREPHGQVRWEVFPLCSLHINLILGPSYFRNTLSPWQFGQKPCTWLLAAVIIWQNLHLHQDTIPSIETQKVNDQKNEASRLDQKDSIGIHYLARTCMVGLTRQNFDLILLGSSGAYLLATIGKSLSPCYESPVSISLHVDDFEFKCSSVCRRPNQVRLQFLVPHYLIKIVRFLKHIVFIEDFIVFMHWTGYGLDIVIVIEIFEWLIIFEYATVCVLQPLGIFSSRMRRGYWRCTKSFCCEGIRKTARSTGQSMSFEASVLYGWQTIREHTRRCIREQFYTTYLFSNSQWRSSACYTRDALFLTQIGICCSSKAVI